MEKDREDNKGMFSKNKKKIKKYIMLKGVENALKKSWRKKQGKKHFPLTQKQKKKKVHGGGSRGILRRN